MDGNKNALIVIAEDSITQAEQLKHILQKEGYKVLHGLNGKKAFSIIKSHVPALIISDILMPEMNGYEMCKLLKTDEALKNIPVILLTSLTEPTDIIEGLKCGADNFITKPYDEKHLVSCIENALLNMQLRKQDSTETGIEISFKGANYHITSNRLQILDLLLSTY
ncbi:MAG: response regulator, partial [Bacteroidales bacterium]|nr:response regulator [Bacteroidales bacterium]